MVGTIVCEVKMMFDIWEWRRPPHHHPVPLLHELEEPRVTYTCGEIFSPPIVFGQACMTQCKCITISLSWEQTTNCNFTNRKFVLTRKVHLCMCPALPLVHINQSPSSQQIQRLRYTSSHRSGSKF
ncbi:hypothetical protein CUMW_207890 [Citrus unshiu]|uniref:Uncharacterized protein n=1 Tax=Citrus unshiu TaxID=55188 RepID=A0A2H5Q964_CITUN|nr:hypothetical protein CUMW_207890 [Citrus unshiu]